MRSLRESELADALTALEVVARVGLPNYFDDQRFGSVGEPAEFVAKEMVFGRFERALWLALAAPYEHDRADAKREKADAPHPLGGLAAVQIETAKGARAAAWSITWSRTPPTSKARRPAFARTYRVCICPRTRAPSGTECSRNGSFGKSVATISARSN